MDKYKSERDEEIIELNFIWFRMMGISMNTTDADNYNLDYNSHLNIH